MLLLPTQMKRRTVPAETPRVVVPVEGDLPDGVVRVVKLAVPSYPLVYAAVGPQFQIAGDIPGVDNIGAKPEDIGFGTRTYLWSPVFGGQLYTWELRPEQWLTLQTTKMFITLGVIIEYHWRGEGSPPRPPPRLYVDEVPPEFVPPQAQDEVLE